MLASDPAVTVMTCVAFAVPNGNGKVSSTLPAVAGRGGAALGRCSCGVDADGPALAAGLGDAEAESGRMDADGLPDTAVLQAAIDAATTAVTASVRAAPPGRRPPTTRPGCHETPMRIRGWADGTSQRMIVTKLLCGIATQPAVAYPSVTCRKNAEPCGYAAAPDGVLMTTA